MYEKFCFQNKCLVLPSVFFLRNDSSANRWQHWSLKYCQKLCYIPIEKNKLNVFVIQKVEKSKTLVIHQRRHLKNTLFRYDKNVYYTTSMNIIFQYCGAGVGADKFRWSRSRGVGIVRWYAARVWVDTIAYVEDGNFCRFLSRIDDCI